MLLLMSCIGVIVKSEAMLSFPKGAKCHYCEYFRNHMLYETFLENCQWPAASVSMYLSRAAVLPDSKQQAYYFQSWFQLFLKC